MVCALVSQPQVISLPRVSGTRAVSGTRVVARITPSSFPTSFLFTTLTRRSRRPTSLPHVITLRLSPPVAGIAVRYPLVAVSCYPIAHVVSRELNRARSQTRSVIAARTAPFVTCARSSVILPNSCICVLSQLTRTRSHYAHEQSLGVRKQGSVVFISERSELELIGDKYAETVLQNGGGLERMSGGDAKVGKGNAGVGKFREIQCPEYEYRHWCTKVSPGVQITPGGLSRYREKC